MLQEKIYRFQIQKKYTGFKYRIPAEFRAESRAMQKQPDKLCFFIRDLRLEQALLDLKGNQKLKSCFEETFSILKNYDASHSASLMDTLKALTKAGGSKAQAADKLFLHRNTLIYRIKKIEELTGMDLTDHDTISRLTFLFIIEPYL